MNGIILHRQRWQKARGGWKYFLLEWTTSLDTSSRTLYWNGQLVWTPALGLYLWGCVSTFTSNVELRNNVRLLLNVELRNITSDCWTSSYVRMLFKYCGIIGLLVNIPITICITVIPPLPSPTSLPTLPLPHVPSPPSLPHPPFPPSNKFIVLSSLSKALVCEDVCPRHVERRVT